MVNISQYQGNISLLSSYIQGVLVKVRDSPLTILQSHVSLLESVVEFVTKKLDNQSEKLAPEALFNIDAELYKIQKLCYLISVEDGNLAKDGHRIHDDYQHALKALKILVSLVSYRRKLKSSITSLIGTLGETGVIPIHITLPPGPEREAIHDTTAAEFLTAFIVTMKATPAALRPEGFDLDVSYEDLDAADVSRIPAAFQIIKDVATKGLNEQAFPMSGSLQKMLSSCGRVIEADKAGLFLTKGLKTSIDFMRDLDEIMLRMLYAKPSLLQDIEANFDNPSSKDVLGEGMMGMVLNGTVHNKPAALKRLDMKVTVMHQLSADGRNELISEMRLRTLAYHHKNIVEMLGIVIHADMLYLMYERLNISLEFMLHGYGTKALDHNLMSEIAVGIAGGLSFLHQRNAVHGGLHPDNVVLRGIDKHGNVDLRALEVKLTDFGGKIIKKDLVLKAIMASGQDLQARARRLKIYDAPEVMTDAKFSSASDVYSFALVFWEMGAHNQERPYEGLGDKLFDFVVNEKRRPDVENTRLEPWMKALVHKSWTHEPWVRPSATEALQAIEKEMAGSIAMPPPVPQNDIVRTAPTPSAEDFSDGIDRRSGGVGKRIPARKNSFTTRRPTAELRNSARRMVQQLAFNPAQTTNSRQSGSRLSRVRSSVQRPNQRASSMSRQSVVLQAKKFEFLQDVTAATSPDVAVKIVKSMRFFVKDAELQLRGIAALRHLLEREEEGIQRWIFRTGAGQAILTAMKLHANEAAVIEPACGAIANLCEDEDNAEPLLRLGALDVVMTAMKTHMKDLPVVEEGLIALTNLCGGDLEKKKWLIQQNADALIARCIENFPQGARVQQEGYAAIGTLQPAYYEGLVPTAAMTQSLRKTKKENKEKMLDFFERKAHLRIATGLKTIRNHPGVVQEAAIALSSMAVGVGKRKIDIVKTGVVPLFTVALSQNPENPALFEAIFQFVSLVATEKKTHGALLKANIHTQIFIGLAKYCDPEYDESLQFHGIMALHNMVLRDRRVGKVFRIKGQGIAPALRVVDVFSKSTHKVLYKKARDLENLVAHYGVYVPGYRGPNRKAHDDSSDEED